VDAASRPIDHGLQPSTVGFRPRLYASIGIWGWRIILTGIRLQPRDRRSATASWGAARHWFAMEWKWGEDKCPSRAFITRVAWQKIGCSRPDCSSREYRRLVFSAISGVMLDWGWPALQFLESASHGSESGVDSPRHPRNGRCSSAFSISRAVFWRAPGASSGFDRCFAAPRSSSLTGIGTTNGTAGSFIFSSPSSSPTGQTYCPKQFARPVAGRGLCWFATAGCSTVTMTLSGIHIRPHRPQAPVT